MTFHFSIRLGKAADIHFVPARLVRHVREETTVRGQPRLVLVEVRVENRDGIAIGQVANPAVAEPGTKDQVLSIGRPMEWSDALAVRGFEEFDDFPTAIGGDLEKA